MLRRILGVKYLIFLRDRLPLGEILAQTVVSALN